MDPLITRVFVPLHWTPRQLEERHYSPQQSVLRPCLQDGQELLLVVAVAVVAVVHAYLALTAKGITTVCPSGGSDSELTTSFSVSWRREFLTRLDGSTNCLCVSRVLVQCVLARVMSGWIHGGHHDH